MSLIFQDMLQDLRYGARLLAKTPGLSAVLVLTLALGIGANTAIFSVLNAWLLRPLPVPHPNQIVVLASPSQEKFSYADLIDFRRQTGDSFSGVCAYGIGIGGLSIDTKGREFAYGTVSGDYFEVLGVKAAAGRLFLPGEGEHTGEELHVVLGYSFWKKKLQGDPAIVGKRVSINGQAAVVVGVVEPQFHGTFFAFEMDGYLPLSAMAAGKDGAAFWTDRSNRQLTAMARLKPGVSLAQVRSSVSLVCARLAAAYPQTNKEFFVDVLREPMTRPAPFVASFVPATAGLFLALAGLVLVVACLNVVNVLLARGLARQREIAIRTSLGAARARVIRQLITESLLIAVLGAVVGLIVGEWAVSLSGRMLHAVTTSTNFGFEMDAGLDWRVFLYAVAAVVVVEAVAGILPAYRASRVQLNAVLHDGGSSSVSGRPARTRGALLAVQVAGSLLLLTIAAMFVRSLAHAHHMDLGFDADHVLTIMLDPAQIGYSEDRAKIFYGDLKEHAAALPGVESVSLAYATPMNYPGHSGSIFVEGQPVAPDRQPPAISYNSVGPSYFATLRIPVLSGRGFEESDSESAPRVAVVNETMARRLWPGENAMGKRFSVSSSNGPLLEVVGIAKDGQYLFLSPAPQAYFYVPLAQTFTTFLSLQVRTNGSPERFLVPIEDQIRRLDPDMPVIDAKTLRAAVDGLAGLFVFRLAAVLASLLGMLGLALALVGIYGVVSYSVSRRTHEFGIRIALGASRSDVLNLALRQGLTVVLAGILLGLLASWAFTHAIAKLLIGVSPGDPWTYLVVSLALSTIVLLACWVPARRATRVDPMVSLRHE